VWVGTVPSCDLRVAPCRRCDRAMLGVSTGLVQSPEPRSRRSPGRCSRRGERRLGRAGRPKRLSRAPSPDVDVDRSLTAVFRLHIISDWRVGSHRAASPTGAQR